ncbi:MAG: hypothetical protein ACOYMF_04355 [Bacteroidales bacterium]
MKKHLTLLIILIAAIACQQQKKTDLNKPLAADSSIYDPVPSNDIVFVVLAKDIDFNKIDTKGIVQELRKAKFLQIKPSAKQDISDPAQAIIKVYRVEDITCGYLKKHFSNHSPGDIVYEYDDKLLVKTKDGIIKIFHGHPEKKID